MCFNVITMFTIIILIKMLMDQKGFIFFMVNFEVQYDLDMFFFIEPVFLDDYSVGM